MLGPADWRHRPSPVGTVARMVTIPNTQSGRLGEEKRTDMTNWPTRSPRIARRAVMSCGNSRCGVVTVAAHRSRKCRISAAYFSSG